MHMVKHSAWQHALHYNMIRQVQSLRMPCLVAYSTLQPVKCLQSACFLTLPCLRQLFILFRFFFAAVGSGENSSDDDNFLEAAASRQTNSGANLADPDASSSGAQPFILPKQIHSAASLVNGVSSRLKASPSQSVATQDPMRLSRGSAQVQDQAEVGRGSVPHDQAHWQDDYATNWDRVGMGRNASPSDAAAAAMQQVCCPTSMQDDSHDKSGKGKAWACKLCTFAANPNHLLRCDVCDTVRGSTLQGYREPATDVAIDVRQSVPPCQSERYQGSNAGLTRKSQSRKHPQHSIAKFLGSMKQSGAEADGATPNIMHSRQGEATVQQEKSVACSAWIRAEFDSEVRWQCAKCKCWLQTEQKAEHEDYHLALGLQHQSSGVQPSRTGHIPSKRQKSCTTG